MALYGTANCKVDALKMSIAISLGVAVHINQAPDGFECESGKKRWL